MTRMAVVAGVGPGLGAAVARRFAAEGCRVALLARTKSYLDTLAADLDGTAGAGLAVPTDLTDADAVESAFETIRAEWGPTDALVYNASGAPWQGVDISLDAFDHALATGPRGALLCAREAAADMVDGDADAGDGKAGTIVFTGATTSTRGREGALGFSAAKFAVRGMAQSLARELGPDGVHVAHVVLDGSIRPPDVVPSDPPTHLDPDDIAGRYWDLVTADPATMPFEIHLTNGPGGKTEFV
ncbi:SDR family NAD(P)-dependent oxidoreductase [Haloplanus aerogenes]|uniref:NADP-dependent 3-hydroxy acid dehydrogenase YdfG n=1 Tax=Haloplanus aerogenes TaxID=660522 RepID=A0A3M0DB97_9EURY|nr:SDR family NAD(P)-dependent oxidoreductase [Haloplanus aerogenes]AZH23953.1 SDR family NAD(P)-dependent oxidoreductase [Haloplanus aerogenes]RMB13283.1 NADP-dependent 3-hydroxy acid dehydrogenase YdfG [Haloplanus aerogenes]